MFSEKLFWLFTAERELSVLSWSEIAVSSRQLLGGFARTGIAPVF